jgi:hypothetical protein
MNGTYRTYPSAGFFVIEHVGQARPNVSLQCEICGRWRTAYVRLHGSGPMPSVCSDSCKRESQSRRVRRTMARMSRCQQCGRLFANLSEHECVDSLDPAHVASRFWSKVVWTEGCWEWRGPRDENGYGRLMIKRADEPDQVKAWSPRLAHRVSWQINRGPISDGLCVLHRCDNPPCVNPEHLFLGTMKDNTADMMAKKRDGARTHPERVPRGESHGRAKLTSAQVVDIRAQAAAGTPMPSIAQAFCISNTHAHYIVKRKVWRSV